jgi:hypothetical protein
MEEGAEEEDGGKWAKVGRGKWEKKQKRKERPKGKPGLNKREKWEEEGNRFYLEWMRPPQPNSSRKLAAMATGGGIGHTFLGCFILLDFGGWNILWMECLLLSIKFDRAGNKRGMARKIVWNLIGGESRKGKFRVNCAAKYGEGKGKG